VDGQPDRAGLVHDRPLDALTDPPGGVRGEAESALWVEFLHRPDETEVALFDQVQQRQITVELTPRDLDHQPQVAFDHPLTCGLTAFLGQPREITSSAAVNRGERRFR
jgi:hypothetical protein